MDPLICSASGTPWKKHGLRLAIWDIDNCLSDDHWRLPLVDWDKSGNERYHNYNLRMGEDAVVHLDKFKFMCQFTIPVFFTGRCRMFEGMTRDWLQSKVGAVVSPELLYMRGNDEKLTPAALKERMLHDLLQHVPITAIVTAFDDLQVVIDMYRAYHIPAVRLFARDTVEAYGASDLKPHKV